ncbi:MAG: hypothetical protein A2Y86_08425 [Candidatus Aminicenantes bacterium RBG_13_62_12]|nr:MAG: hypothetical protein A2Y86_08425 [Candidatus Aminicenantes bacterium RBG_13_62_12]
MSPILDAGALSSWGRITWRGETPSGTSLQLQTRSGNASEPTAAWSEWSPPYKKPEGEAILSPGGRYLQFRALFRKASGRLGPALRLVEAYYLQANAAPVVKKLEALPPNEVFIKPPETEEVILGSPHPSAGDKMGRTDILISLAKKTSRKGFRTLLWEAEDGNGDSLTYSLSVRRAGESGWKLLERDWKEAVFALDTVSLPDGVYDFKVVASDKPSNPAGRELQGEKTSLPLTIDNTPPLFRDVTVSRDGTKLKVGFQAEDALSPLLEIKVLVRPLEWLTVFPVDGICDSMQEAFSFVLDLPAGSDDLLTVVALDAHGNSGVLRQSFPR